MGSTDAFTNHLRAFVGAMASLILTPPAPIIADGKIHRFSVSGKRGDDAGWYVLHTDGIPAGAFGNWREGFTQTWCAKSRDTQTQAEREAYKLHMDAIKAERDADTAQRNQEAAHTARKRWDAATIATEHPYLTAKGVNPYGVKVDGDGFLIVPMRDVEGEVWNIERINPMNFKDKKGLLGGRRTGLYHAIGKPDRLLIVCEGYATGASIHEATGRAVAVAFNAGNLAPVALALHSKYPSMTIVIAADDDHQTAGNPGMTKAQEAGLAASAAVAVPVFPADRPDEATDFNDLHQLAGLNAVKACVDAAQVSVLIQTISTWEPPMPLPDPLPPVAAFDVELLPTALRGWVMDIAHRMQCPVDFVAVGAVVSLSGLIGARAVVAPKERDDWRVVPNLWGLIVGRPGVKKSPALGEAMKPLHRLEGAERELWAAAHEAWELDCKVAELATKHNEKQAATQAVKDPAKARALLEPVEAPPEPTMRRYVVNDATVEKLGDLLTVNTWGLLVYRDELHGLLCSMDRAGQEGARGFYLTGYDGNQGYAVDRIGRGESYVPRVCLAMLGGIQPGKIQSYVRDAVAGGAGDDGLLQRFGMAVWPDTDADYIHVDQWPDTPAKQTAWEVFDRLSALQPASDTDPTEWRFTQQAQSVFNEWITAFETEIRGDALHPALVSHLAKYRKLIPALALVFALVDTPDAGAIGETELLRALAWGDYLRTHAERMYAAAVIPETTAAQTLLNRIKGGKLCDGDGVLLESFTPRLVAVKHWAGLGTPDEVRKAAELLTDYGYLRREEIKSGDKGGRPGERYQVHPDLLKGVA